MKPMSRLLTLATFALLTGCEGGQDLSLVCKGSDAYGVTQFGTLGPWVMTKSGPMVGDIRGVAVGERDGLMHAFGAKNAEPAR